MLLFSKSYKYSIFLMRAFQFKRINIFERFIIDNLLIRKLRIFLRKLSNLMENKFM